MTQTSLPFRFLLRVRYGECDAQKVVFNARYGDYVDLAVTEYMRALCGGFQELFAQGIDNQVVRLDTQWSSPACFDDVLAIDVIPGRLGTTSYSLQLRFSHLADARPVAVSEITYVVVSLGDHQKMPIPDGLRTKLANGAPGVLIDQSGSLPYHRDAPKEIPLGY